MGDGKEDGEDNATDSAVGVVSELVEEMADAVDGEWECPCVWKGR